MIEAQKRSLKEQLINFLVRLSNLLRIPESVNVKWLNAFIVLFTLGNVLLIARTFQLFDYYFHVDYSASSLIVKLILVAWLINSILIFFYRKSVVLGLLQLLLSSFILRAFLTFGIFETTHLCASWSLLFILGLNKYKGDNDSHYQFHALGLYFSVIFFGLVFFQAGMDKLLDPAWQKGVGFQNFIEVEWIIGNGWRNFFLSKPFLVKSANYFTLVAECSFLFLFFFRRLRKIAFLLYIVLAFQLFFPFNIFFIGYLATIFGIPVLMLSFNNSSALNFKPRKRLIYPWVVILFVITGFTYTLISYSADRFKAISYEATWDATISGPQTYEFMELKATPSSFFSEVFTVFKLGDILNPLTFINKRVLRRGPVGLFSSPHTVGVFGYHVILEKKSGELIEPVIFYSQDGSRGQYDKQPFMLNGFQGSMYGIGDLIYKMSYQDSATFFHSSRMLYNKILNPLIDFSIGKSDLDQNEIKRAIVSVYSLGGDCEESPEFQDWREFIEFNFENNTVKFDKIDVSGCKQGRHYLLPNFYQRIIE